MDNKISTVVFTDRFLVFHVQSKHPYSSTFAADSDVKFPETRTVDIARYLQVSEVISGWSPQTCRLVRLGE